MTTPNQPEIFSTNSKQILVTRDPVYNHPAIKDGRYIGRQPHTYLPFAIFCTVINPLFGPLAIMFALMSRKAYQDGDLIYATKWSQYAFMAGCIIIVVSIVLYIAIGFALHDGCVLKDLGGVSECTHGVSGSHSP